MTGAFNRSEQSGYDLDDIFARIAQDNGLGVAVAQLERLEKSLDRIATFRNWDARDVTWVKIHSLCRCGRG